MDISGQMNYNDNALLRFFRISTKDYTNKYKHWKENRHGRSYKNRR